MQTPRRNGALLRRLGRVIIAGAIVLILSGGAAAAIILRTLPEPEELFSRRVVQSTKIYDRTGAILLFEIHGEERRTVIPFSDIPATVKNATIAIEDAGFWRHAGIDLRGILRALLYDIAARDLRQGGSTITQQLVKNSFLGRERTIRRKFREAIYAIALEARLPKEKILDLYLNQIPYGSNAYGVEAAAETLFGKHARELDAAEAALLAALPRAPSYYSPYGQHKDELLARKDHVLDRMESLGYLTAAEAEAARREPLKFLPAARNIRAPHFVMYVRDYLIERYGEEEVNEGGLMVTTTLDWELEGAAEQIVREGAERNEQLIKATNMALVAVDPRTGEILAMVGSRDYFDSEREGNFNVALARRQPGSAFKPFVYATAFTKGLTPETVLFDVPMEFNPGCAPSGVPRPGSGVEAKQCYHPQNYDERFRGPVSLRQAIAQSLNVPSVKVLYLAGIEDSIQTAEAFGITSLEDRSRFGLSLVLGGAEVRLLEMVSAYGAFANDGVLNPPTAILRVEKANGAVLEERRERGRLVIDPEIARIMNDVLSDNDARVPAFQPRSSLYFEDARVAAKTGTTQDYRDAWTIGYTPAIAVGVWAGNNDNAPMQQKGSGVMAAAPSWHRFMEEIALKRFPPEDFQPPAPREAAKPILRGAWQGGEVITIDTVSGKRATEFTPPETRKDLAFGEPHDPLYWIDRKDPPGPPPEHPAADPQYPNWETAFQAWLAASGFTPRPLSSAPQDFDDVHTPENRPVVNAEVTLDSEGGLSLLVNIRSKFALQELTVTSDGRVVAVRERPAPQLRILVSASQFPEGAGALVIRAYDEVGNIGAAEVSLSLDDEPPS
ncbi:MAG: hypothetical protein A3B37_01260 [Candidatus Sungbacteria bacterium RIFCSPLOWO2_01_FULL_59_16]|uniref:Uncharacterized protein n=1 Tax=Candidatus Sungbacteria bacterium RIFCSPLOWO2_01_FULL_59_16 TaxID=1802280 RepID=A0A1G2LEB2_9BACT|nr:MAG: hypothetical protein A3B37_01260 [Candidatus Sungbacteria bacterium RIFCSPLOWO2_01_FULL_59_16]